MEQSLDLPTEQKAQAGQAQPQSAPEPIANHAAAHSLRRGETHPGPHLPRHPKADHGEVWSRNPKASLVYRKEIGAPQKPGLLGEGKIALRAIDRITWRSERLSPS